MHFQAEQQATATVVSQQEGGIPAISKIVAFLSLDMSRAFRRSAGAAICFVRESRRATVSFRNSRKDSNSASLFSFRGLANRCSAARHNQQLAQTTPHWSFSLYMHSAAAAQ